MPSLGVEIAIIEHDRILLTKREDFEVWCLPGGAVEDGETLEQAAAREALEETGFTIQITCLVGMYSQPQWNNGSHHFAVFAGEPVSGTLRLALGETVDVGFFDRGALPEPLVAWHHQPIADALDGVTGVARMIESRWPFAAHLTRAEIYALRDQSGLSRQEFFLQHWERSQQGDGTGEEQHA